MLPHSSPTPGIAHGLGRRVALVGALALFGVAPADACSRVFSSAASNGQAMVVGRTMDLFINDNAALLGKLVSDGLNERGLNANLTRRKPTSTA
jgi:penicillin V acylase-like amidase (Ntn superfamily)